MQSSLPFPASKQTTAKSCKVAGCCYFGCFIFNVVEREGGKTAVLDCLLITAISSTRQCMFSLYLLILSYSRHIHSFLHS